MLRRSNGSSSEELGSLVVPAGVQSDDTLVVEAIGTSLRVHLGSSPDKRLEVEDGHYSHGSLGLRVVGTHAVFSRLSVVPVDGGPVRRRS